MSLAPVMKSPGSKWRIADRIVAMLPRHRIYLEPYFGSGAVFFSKPPSKIETVNDADGEIANLFGVLRDPARRERLVEAVELTPWSEAELFAACKVAEGLGEVERARRLVVRSWMNTGSRRFGTAHFAHAAAGSGGSSGKTWATLPARIRAAGERLREVQVLCRDARAVITAHASEEVLIYADPPYPHATRTGHGPLYRCEMADADHEKLLTVLREHPGPALVSSYSSEMYDEALAGWKRVELTGRSQGHGTTTEVLWMNLAAVHRSTPTLF